MKDNLRIILRLSAGLAALRLLLVPSLEQYDFKEMDRKKVHHVNRLKHCTAIKTIPGVPDHVETNHAISGHSKTNDIGTPQNFEISIVHSYLFQLIHRMQCNLSLMKRLQEIISLNFELSNLNLKSI